MSFPKLHDRLDVPGVVPAALLTSLGFLGLTPFSHLITSAIVMCVISAPAVLWLRLRLSPSRAAHPSRSQ